ncbi:MAG: zinc ABC transporter substrate-binding protein [Proteobacteria bacterium]|nr:zinc ABC transporter substrate-binding protein [Pseudomonadota bacterium]MBU1584096.1 zinc ABC transporter substrate-binding protein [Pseudomonadota bacterium]MBU2453694.1 zinc ABC transporter substrate-binding protein [Pseudomonadota bacterium]MBU2629664.1 zinc ABC transporter substrate-binding protein [Pseudomonadota bacterium]
MKFIINSLISAAVAFFCLLPLDTFAKTPLKVHVSILPQKYFVERVGRDRVKVDVLLRPGKNPATYAPTPDQIKTLLSSDLYFRIGVPFENSILHKIESIAGTTVIDTRQGIDLREMAEHYHEGKDLDTALKIQPNDTDRHDNEKQHAPVGRDPHIWMSPALVKTQAHTIFKALSRIDPAGKDGYKTNYDLFVKDLDALDNRFKTALQDHKGENLFVFHPSFGYLTDAYGLKQIAVETMGKAPKGKALSNIIKLAKQQNARVIFVQPQFDVNAAQKIASAINGAVVSIDPLAYDYLANMENIVQTIAKTLQDKHE